jgi:glutathione S-transferase
MKLNNNDIRTKEVLDWKGLHLLHFQTSACSQKTRIFLNLKNISWKSKSINLVSNENYSDWFLGINPRAQVPVLIDLGEDGMNEVIKRAREEVLKEIEEERNGKKRWRLWG